MADGAERGRHAFPPLDGTPAEVRLDAPLIHTTNLKVFSQGIRLAAGGDDAFEWLVGAFYQDIERDYGQNLPVPGYDALLARTGLPPSTSFNAPPDIETRFRDLRLDIRRGHTGIGECNV